MKEHILNALKRITEPSLGKDIVSLDMVQNLQVEDGVVRLKVVVRTPPNPKHRELEENIRRSLEAIPGVKQLQLTMAADIASGPKARPDTRLSEVKEIIAVASGKGGVGKSTVAINLAVSMAHGGVRVGLMDADIYGPSVPTLMGLKNTPPLVDQNKKKIIPLEKYGIKTISIGYLMREEDAAVWRGPMVGRMLQQFVDDVDWGELDYLFLDFPPGTGDAQLSLAQIVPISGSVIVTTPQDVALADVVRGVTMFQKVQVPTLGVVENMSYYLCPHCNERSEIFGHGGGRRKAEELKVPFLGEIPLEIGTRIGSDEGKPITVTQPDSAQAQAFREIGRRMVEQLKAMGESRPAINL
jgi:ATP-binding protein involved in chromosome partitioning